MWQHCAKCWHMWPYLILTAICEGAIIIPIFLQVESEAHRGSVTCPRVHSFKEVEPGLEPRLSDSRTCVLNHATGFPQNVSIEYRCAELNHLLQQQPQEPAIKIWGHFVILFQPIICFVSRPRSHMHPFSDNAVNRSRVPKEFLSLLKTLKVEGHGADQERPGPELVVIKALGKVGVTARNLVDQIIWVRCQNSHLDQWCFTFNSCKTLTTILNSLLFRKMHKLTCQKSVFRSPDLKMPV